jgi:hypothetical protein
VTRLNPRFGISVFYFAMIAAFGLNTANALIPANTERTNAFRILSLPFGEATDLSQVNEVWYVFTAIETVGVRFPWFTNTTGLATLTVYSEESDQPLEGWNTLGMRDFVAIAGETYYFKVSRYFDYFPGPSDLTLVAVPFPPVGAISLFENRLFIQAQAHGPPRIKTNGGSFSVSVNYTSGITPLVLRFPDGRRAKLTNVFDAFFEVNESFSSRTEMDLFFPAGTYSITLPPSSYFTNISFLNVPRSFFPLAPRLLNWNAAQRINPYLPFELRITRPERYATYNTAMNVGIGRPGEQMLVWFTEVGLNKVIIPDGILEPNTRYQCWINVYYFRSSQPYGDTYFPRQLTDTAVYFSATTETEIHTR